MDSEKRPYLVGSTRYVTVGNEDRTEGKRLGLGNNHLPDNLCKCLLFCYML